MRLIAFVMLVCTLACSHAGAQIVYLAQARRIVETSFGQYFITAPGFDRWVIAGGPYRQDSTLTLSSIRADMYLDDRNRPPWRSFANEFNVTFRITEPVSFTLSSVMTRFSGFAWFRLSKIGGPADVIAGHQWGIPLQGRFEPGDYIFDVRASRDDTMDISFLLEVMPEASTEQWRGPAGPDARVDYTRGNVYVGTPLFTNPIVRFDVVETADTGRTISAHAFAGTPPSNDRTTAIWGETNNPNGRGLQGFNFATEPWTLEPSAGLWGESASINGQGVRARVTNTIGQSYAGYFDAASNAGTAVYATATGTTGTTYGVWGNVASATGYAGYFTRGRNSLEGNTGIGVIDPKAKLHVFNAAAGFTVDPAAISADETVIIAAAEANLSLYSPSVGDFGPRLSFKEVSGQGTLSNQWGMVRRTGAGFAALNFTFGTGVDGNTNPTMMTLSTAGNLAVTGNLSKAGGSFLIDHPLRPASQYLYHSFVESPDMLNIYNGIVTTNNDGFATIALPEYFDALNRDPQYELTVLGDGPWSLARVARKIQNNEFIIETSVPNTDVSWQVKAIRKDAWANAHRIPNEVDKERHNQGKYLHPELFGQPASKSIHANTPDPANKSAAPMRLLRQGRQPSVPTTPPLTPATLGVH